MLKELKYQKEKIDLIKQKSIENDFMKIKNEQARKTITRVGLPKELLK